jgi:uncharacterized protein YggE
MRFAQCFFSILLLARACMAQGPEVKFIADTLVVQAEGTFETDPDLATLVFDISSQDKDLKPTYDKASQAMQKIVGLAEKNGLKKEDVSSGVLTVTPYYTGDRKKRTKSFLVQGRIVLKVHDFSKLGTLMDESVTDEITDFRSLTYTLADEETAKQHAVADAMRRAVGRANAALEQKGQKVGTLRFASLDVNQLIGVSQIQELPLNGRNYTDLATLHRLCPIQRKSRSVRPCNAPFRFNRECDSRFRPKRYIKS